jgi:hypothetical protein
LLVVRRWAPSLVGRRRAQGTPWPQVWEESLCDRIRGSAFSSAGKCRGSAVQDGVSRFARRRCVELRRRVLYFSPLSTINKVTSAKINKYRDRLYSIVCVRSNELGHLLFAINQNKPVYTFFPTEKSGSWFGF